MNFIRKKEISKIRVTHNSKLLWIILILVVCFIGIIYFIVQNKDSKPDENKKCVPATCCHPAECVLNEQAPDCSATICSAVCSGPLDCGAGHCEFINNKCAVVPDN